MREKLSTHRRVSKQELECGWKQKPTHPRKACQGGGDLSYRNGELKSRETAAQSQSPGRNTWVWAPHPIPPTDFLLEEKVGGELGKGKRSLQVGNPTWRTLGAGEVVKLPLEVTNLEYVLPLPPPQERMGVSIVKASKSFKKTYICVQYSLVLSSQIQANYSKWSSFHYCDCGFGFRESPSAFEHTYKWAFVKKAKIQTPCIWTTQSLPSGHFRAFTICTTCFQLTCRSELSINPICHN